MQCSWISSHTAVWHQNHPPELLRVEILDQLNTAPHIFMWRSSKGMHCFSQQHLQGGHVPTKPCETQNKNEDWQILAGNYELSPILCTDFMLAIPLSSASVCVALVSDKARRRKGLWVCHCQHVTNFLNTEQMLKARYPSQIPNPIHFLHSSAW